MIAMELFSCSGGMAEGFRRAGIVFQHVIDWDKDACASYEANLHHRPYRMDAKDLLRMVETGWSPGPLDLLVADPPCTPWSIAGKRKGLLDDRDTLLPTIRLIRLLRPRAFLIGNVPGLELHLDLVARLFAPLREVGYCTRDFFTLDAADYGVPQHRVRPFWFGHLKGDCLMVPPRTHCDPKDESLRSHALFGEHLRPWVTCGEALVGLEGADLGRPVKLRKRGANSKHHGSVEQRPARVVGTSNLSDGNVLLPWAMPSPAKATSTQPRASSSSEPTGVVTTRQNGDGNILSLSPREGRRRASGKTNHAPSSADAPARTLTRNTHSDGSIITLDDRYERFQRPNDPETVARTLCGGDGATNNTPDAPSMAVCTKDNMQGAQGAATTVCADDRLAPPGHHEDSFLSYSSSGTEAILLSEKAGARLQGFPDGWVFAGKTKGSRWGQLGMAMPPPLAEAVARQIVRYFAKLDAQGGVKGGAKSA